MPEEQVREEQGDALWIRAGHRSDLMRSGKVTSVSKRNVRA